MKGIYKVIERIITYFRIRKALKIKRIIVRVDNKNLVDVTPLILYNIIHLDQTRDFLILEKGTLTINLLDAKIKI